MTTTTSIWQRFVNRIFDPQRYCRCGLENAVDAVAIHDGKTGSVKAYRWGVACPKADATFGVEPGYWSGNGWLSEHYHSDDTHQPSWLPATLADQLKRDATDFGYCSESKVPSAALDREVVA